MMRDRFAYLMLTAGGLGAIPFAPGTWGALMGIVCYLPAAALAEPVQSLALAGLLAAWSIATIAFGPWAERYFGKKDAQAIVSDEVAGLLLTLLLFHPFPSPWTNLLWAFPATRVFDIVKLPPARRWEKLPHGWGVLLDDLQSSLYAAGFLHALLWFTSNAR